MMRRSGIAALAAAAALQVLAATSAHAAAWGSPEGTLVVTQTSLMDLYDIYARNSTNNLLLEKPKGSVVQVGDVRRFGFFLTGEYALSDRVTAQLSAAYFVTQQVNVGKNARDFTNAKPNTQTGLQDLTGVLKYLAFQRQGTVSVGVAPYLGFAFPLNNYNTTVNNPIGDGILSLDLAVAISAALPKMGLFFNADAVYRVREKKKLAAGQIFDQVQFMFEAGYIIHPRLSIRLMTRYYESLGGQDLNFNPPPGAAGLDAMQLYENPLVYNQDALFVGGGPYWQIVDSFGVGLNYVQAVWFRDHANVKTVVLSLSFSPEMSRPRPEELLPPAPEEEAPPEAGAPTAAPAATPAP